MRAVNGAGCENAIDIGLFLPMPLVAERCDTFTRRGRNTELHFQPNDIIEPVQHAIIFRIYCWRNILFRAACTKRKDPSA